MNYLIRFTLIIICGFLLSCSAPNEFTEIPDVSVPTIKQGIYGTVEFWEGDFMPSVPHSSGTITPVSRKVFIYELTNMNEVNSVGYSPFYSEIFTALIATVYSGNNGFFEIELSPGEYSVFVRENDLYYANLFDGRGYIFPVEVKKDSLSRVTFSITYKATF